MGEKLTRSDLQAIRGIVRSEIRKSAFSKLCGVMKLIMIVLSAAAMIYCILTLTGKLTDSEEIEEAEE